MSRTNGRKRAAAFIIPVTALAIVTAACGGGESAVSKAKKAGGFCDTTLTVDSKSTQLGPPGDPSDPEVQAATKAFATELTPIVAGWVEAAPKDVKPATEAMLAGLTAAGQAGDPSALQSPEFSAHNLTVQRWVHDNCGFQKLDVSGADYKFEGLPATVKSGKTSLIFNNVTTANELHELVLVRKKDGVTDAAMDLLMLPEEEVGAKVDFLGVTVAPPGQTSATTLDITPGDYIAVCFIPVGSGDEGPPHAMSGMISEFSVS